MFDDTNASGSSVGGSGFPGASFVSSAFPSGTGGLGTAGPLSLSGQGILQPLDSRDGVFLVSGTPGAAVQLDGILSFRDTAYKNEVGVFVVDGDGKVDGLAPGAPGYANAALRSASRRTLVQSGEKTGAWEPFSAVAGSHLAFYLIQNDSITNWLGQADRGQTTRPVLFSIDQANPSGLERMRSADLGNGILSMAWEDRLTNSDNDFNDVMLQVHRPGYVVPGETGGAATLTVERVEKSSRYLSEMGIYLTDSPDGKVDGLSPGDPGYRQAVFSQGRQRKLLAAKPPGTQASLELPSGSSFGWYLIANGTSESLARGKGEVFFSHAAANRDGLNHVHAQGNGATLAWEDLLGGGDRDFNDLVFQYTFEPTTPTTNRPPVVDADKTLQVAGPATDLPLAIQPPVDPDGDPLRISVSQLPDQAKGSILRADGTALRLNDVLTSAELTGLRYRPLETASEGGSRGSFSYLVSDGRGGEDSQRISFESPGPGVQSLQRPNTAPRFTENPAQSLTAGTAYQSRTGAVDDEGDPILFSLLRAPEGLSLDPSTGALSWLNPQAGGHDLAIVAEDGRGGKSVQETTLLVGVPSNQPPLFVSTPAAQTSAGQAYGYKAEASDPDGDGLVYSLLNGPVEASIDPSTGQISWVPAQAGPVALSVQASDQRGGIARQDFTVLVLPPGENAAPVIISEPLLTGSVRRPYDSTVKALDGDGDPITYGLLDAPQGMTIDPVSGRLQWDPASAGAGNYRVVVSATDPSGGQDSQEFQLAIAAATGGTISGSKWNDLDADGLRDTQAAGGVDEPGLGDITIYLDLDKDGTLDAGEPLQITDPSGSYAFTGLTAGVYQVREVVPDGYIPTFPSSSGGKLDRVLFDGTFNDADWEQFIFTFDANPNDPIPPDGIQVKQEASGGNPGSYRSNRHAWSSGQPTIDISINKNYTYTPATDGPIFSIDFSQDLINNPFFGVVGSGIGIEQDNDYYIAAIGFNNQQWFTSTIPNIRANDFVHIRNSVTGLNEPTKKPDFSLNGAPIRFGYERGTIIPSFQDIRTGIDNWTVAINVPEAGLHTITLATDQQVGGIDFGNHKLPAPNQAPLITSTPPAAVSLGSSLRYDVKASDANGDRLSYTLLQNPDGMVIDPERGVLIWTPKSGQVGRSAVELEVADGNGGTARQSFELVVKGANLPPQIVSTPPITAALNAPYRYEVLASDPDADALTYSLVRAPEGMTIDPDTGVVTYTPTSSSSSSPVEILVSDGFGGSSRQSFELAIGSSAGSALPRITSIPPVITGAGSPYAYQVTATDPAGSPLTYALVDPPAGMVMDPQSGRLTWTPAASVTGPFVITVSATNAEGLQAFQSFGLTVVPNQAPILGSTAPLKAQAGALFKYDVVGGDADGNLLGYRLVQGPAGMTLDAFGRLRWQPTEADRGSTPVILELDDGRGGLTRQQFALEVSSADVTAPVLELGYSSTLVNLGESVELQVRARDNFSVVALILTANDLPLTLTPGDPNRVLNTARLENLAAGRYRVVATATDAAGNSSSETVEIRVVDPADTVAPVITIDRSNLLPSEGVLRTPTDVVVSVEDANLDVYRVEIAPLDAVNLDQIGADDPDFVLLAEGNSNVVNQVVASLDPRLYANGSYLLRVVGYDLSGNGTAEGVILTLESAVKPGDYALEFTDLSVPLGNLPITINRRYSSLESGGLGDFGYGWQLTMQDARITEASPDGRDLQATGGDLFGSSTAFSVGTRVSLTTPEGRRVSFTFDAVPTSGSLFGTIYSPRFKADPGVFDRLEVDNVPLSLRGDGTVGSYVFSFIGYNPSLYRLISKDGTTYHYDQFFGLQKVVDRNGNMLTYSDNGITSSTGASVSFQRDGLGRITSITDPAGQAIRYSYDSNGNLATVTDREDAVTGLRYDDTDRPHYLTEVKDPLGRQTSRTEFDSKGQISKLIDADGNAVEVNLDSAASSQTVKDPLGNSTTRLFDDRGRVVQELDALGGKTFYTYNTNDKLLSRTDPEGHVTRYSYDGRGNRLSTTNGAGETTTYTYNERNDLLTQKDPLGNITTYEYDAKGNLIQRTNAAGFISRYEYDANGLPTTITDPIGKKATFTYNGWGQVIGILDPTGAALSPSYDANGWVISSSDGVGAVTHYTYDAQGRLLDTIDALGGTQRIEYDAAGQLIAEVDALGRRTAYRYDGRGNRIETILPDATPGTDADNPRQQQSFDALDRLIASTDELGRTTHYVYDALGRQVEQILPNATPADPGDNPRRRQEFDKAGRLIAAIDELGNRSTSSYDAADRLIRWSNALDQATSYGYDAAGRQTSITDALGRTTTYGYDPLGRLIRTTYANDTAMSQRRDGMGRVIEQTDLSGLKTGYEYDGLGRLTAVIDALNQRTEYRYDAAGNLIEQEDANGHITKFAYDLLKRQVSATLPGGQVSRMAYDAVGNLIETTDANGTSTRQSFDARNWLVEKRFSDGTPTEQFNYTATGQLASVIDDRGTTAYQYDERNRLLGRSEPDGRAITYTYDAAGNILSLNVPSGSTHYGYDVLNRLKTVTDADGGVTIYGYDSVGNLVNTLFANNVTETRRYDELNRLTFLENRSPGDVVLSSYAYSLDAMGNRTRVVEADGRTVNYSYDDLHRLVQEAITDPVNGNRTIAYLMDTVGNRLKRTDSVEGTTTYSYDVNDRLLQEVLGGNTISYQYDANGSLTAKVSGSGESTIFRWNAKGELSQAEITDNDVTISVAYDYDNNGILVSRSENGATTRYLIDDKQSLFAQVIEAYNEATNAKVHYTFGNSLISVSSAETTYYLVDAIGSTRQIANSSGNVSIDFDYDAFGVPFQASPDRSDEHLFAGEVLDSAIDSIYLRARYYSPDNGRFFSKDPFSGYNNQPITLHDYIYAGQNPVLFVDPSGKSLIETNKLYEAQQALIWRIIGSQAQGAVAAATEWINICIKFYGNPHSKLNTSGFLQAMAQAYLNGATTGIALTLLLGPWGFVAGILVTFGMQMWGLNSPAPVDS